ncbi:MAG: DUF459 domain-containing protein [Myxococcota bacterium]|nr:DUF459 domain-containing protein [Myxococcota bacterium]
MKKIVIDKYIPVKTNYDGYTPPSIAIMGGWICALFVALFFARDLHIYAQGQNAQVRTGLSQGTSALQNISNSLLPQDQNALNPAMQRLYNKDYRLGTQLTMPEQPPIQTTKKRKRQPKRVLVLGSSSMSGVQGAHLGKLLRKNANLTVSRHAKVGSSLARPDFYNWPEIAVGLNTRFKADLVIAQFVGNDCQHLINSDKSIEARYGSYDWEEAYKRRVKAFIRNFQSQNAQVAMVGMPIVRSGSFRKKIAYANRLVQQVSKESNVQYISLWEKSSTPKGNYKADLTLNGQTYRFRQEDGVHLSYMGAKYIANHIYDELNQKHRWTSE